MPLFISARLREKKTLALIKSLQNYEARPNDPGFLCDLGDNCRTFREAYRRLRDAGNDFIKQTISYIDDASEYPNDTDDILGYVIDAEDEADYNNPMSELEVSPTAGCYDARVRNEYAIRLTAVPKGLAAYVGTEVIFRDTFFNLIRGPAIDKFGNVLIGGIPKSDWHRMHYKELSTVIDDSSFQGGFCAFCGAPLRFPTNIWFGFTDGVLKKPLIENVAGRNHLDGQYLLAVPHSVREQLLGKSKKHLFKSICFSPLYSKKSSRYQVVSTINELTSHLPVSKTATGGLAATSWCHDQPLLLNRAEMGSS